MDTLRVGIIGCGQICRVRHAPEYSENPRCQIAGFYDVDPARAQAMAVCRRSALHRFNHMPHVLSPFFSHNWADCIMPRKRTEVKPCGNGRSWRQVKASLSWRIGRTTAVKR